MRPALPRLCLPARAALCVVAVATFARAETAPSGWKAYRGSVARDGDAEEDDEAPVVIGTAAPRLARQQPDARARTTGGAELDLSARHLWRGIATSRGAVVEPSGWIARRGLVLAGSATVGLNDGPASRDALLEPSMRYELPIGGLRVEPALTSYWLPNRAGDTTFEASLELAIAIGEARLTSVSYVDVAKRAGAYFGTVGVEQTHALSPSLRARWFADVGVANAAFNRAYLDTDAHAVNVVELGASLRTELGDALFVSFHSELSNFVAPSLRRWAERPGGGGEKALVNGGVTLGVEL